MLFGLFFLMNIQQVAVKKMPHSSKKEKLSNFRELEFLVKCQHENIVQYSRSYLQNDEIWVCFLLYLSYH